MREMSAADRADLLRMTLTVADAVRTQIARDLADENLTEPLATMLWVLHPSTAPMSMRDVAEKLHCDPSNVTLLSDRLEELGYVERRPHPTDGRRRVLALTEQGTHVYEQMLSRLFEDSPMFRLEPAEQRALLALLTKVASGDGRAPIAATTAAVPARHLNQRSRRRKGTT